jgi:superfamily II DNA or RNA helicase
MAEPNIFTPSNAVLIPPSEEKFYRKYLCPKGSYTPRKGQADCWDNVARNPEQKDHLFILATAYGKTDVLQGAYGIARAQKLVNRLLITVPTDMLRTQTAHDFLDQSNRGRHLNLSYSGVFKITDKTANVLQANRNNEAEVFVITYQQLLSEMEFFERLLSFNKWMIGRDEVHRCAEDQSWGFNSGILCRLPNVRKVINLSATIIRTDRQPLSGIRYTEPTSSGEIRAIADVEVSAVEGIQEGALRPIVGRISNYFIDVITSDGEQRLSTEQLRSEGVTDFSAYEAKKQLRFNSSFVNRMLSEAVIELGNRNARHPYQHQGLVWALSQRHARFVVGEICEQYGGRAVADWIGIERPDKENEEILARYLGYRVKNGRKVEIPPEERLLWLVQIGKAGEGFNNCRSSVLVFMNLVDAPNPSMQYLGRGLRRNYNIPAKEDFAIAFASSDTGMAHLIESMEGVTSVYTPDICQPDRDPCGDSSNGDILMSIPTVEVVNATWDRTDTVLTNGIPDPRGTTRSEEVEKVAGILRQFNITLPPEMSEEDVRNLVAQVSGVKSPVNGSSARSPEPTLEACGEKPARDLHAETEQQGERVQNATRTVVRNILTLEHRSNKKRAGELMKLINSVWCKQSHGLTHDRMSVAQLQKKLEWLACINRVIVSTKRLPSWVTQGSSQ